jgi:hypothetical protein
MYPAIFQEGETAKRMPVGTKNSFMLSTFYLIDQILKQFEIRYTTTFPLQNGG